MRRFQTSKIGTITMFVCAGICLIFTILLFPHLHDSRLAAQLVVFATGIPICLVIGIVMVINNYRSSLARDTGENKTCTVIDKRVTGNRIGTINYFHVIVSFTGANGKVYQHDALVSEQFYCAVRRDSKLRCRVRGTSCYLDPTAPYFADNQSNVKGGH